jgi:hypothetical protein
MKIKAVGVACLFVVGIVAFQNCSQVKFTPTDAASLGSLSVDPNASPNPDPGPVVNIGTVADFSCKTFIDLTVVDGQALDIPARSADGLCYTAKIISAAYFSPSATNPQSDADVISRNHDRGYGNVDMLHHPYVLGSRLVRLILHGERTVKLSGGKNDTAAILVDNFILVGIAPIAQIGTPSFYKAYGTLDSGANGNDHVIFKDVNVGLTAFGTGGVSTIAPLKLEGLVEMQREYGIDVRALDAGGVGQNSEIYLLFK